MIVKVFAVFDKKAEAFMAPFTFPNIGQGVRAFGDVVNRNGSGIARHPEDYDLYDLGSFNDASGEFSGEKHFIIGAVSVMEPRVDPNQMDLNLEDGDGEAEG